MRELIISGPTDVDAGSLAERVTINAASQNRVMRIENAPFSLNGDIHLTGLTLTRGRAFDFGGGILSTRADIQLTLSDVVVERNTSFSDGGGLYIAGDLILQNTTLTANRGDRGGGLFSEGNVTLQDSTVHDNSTSGQDSDGGGVWVGGNLLVTRSTISSNRSGLTSRGKGGGIFAVGEVTLTDSAVVDNEAIGSFGSSSGGGITAFGNVSLTGSTISGNQADFGGGIRVLGNLDVTQSTISGNLASSRGGGIESGGAIGRPSAVNLRWSTVANNTATEFHGGGLFSFSDSVLIDHTIVGANQAGGGNPDLRDDRGMLVVRYSLIGDADGLTITGPGNLVGDSQGAGIIDPRLEPLADNGGITATHGLQAGSLAINAGDPAAVAGVGDVPEFDQRGPGFTRVLQGRIDIGALEADLLPPLVDGDFNDDGLYDCLDIDALVAEIAAGSHTAAFDLNGDGLVDLADRDLWLIESGEANLGAGRSYLLGDATLDGIVDGLDFIEWNNHKFTANNGWCGGDFTADGITDGLDFIEWNNHKFQSSDAVGRPADAGAAQTIAQVAEGNLDERGPREITVALRDDTQSCNLALVSTSKWRWAGYAHNRSFVSPDQQDNGSNRSRSVLDKWFAALGN